jgi:pyruvate,orthophosphate dikinase
MLQMQKGTGLGKVLQRNATMQVLTAEAPVEAARYGRRAERLAGLLRLGLPVPRAVALSFDTVRGIAEGRMPALAPILDALGPGAIVSVRGSPENPDWGGPGTILNIGLNAERAAGLAEILGRETAIAAYANFVRAFAVHVARLDEEDFAAGPAASAEAALAAALTRYEEEMAEPFPQDPTDQLAQVLRAMARAWQGTSARLLRQAKGAPPEAGLGLLVQRMALGLGRGKSGAGTIQTVCPETGAPGIFGRYRSDAQGLLAPPPTDPAHHLTRADGSPSLEDRAPDIFATLVDHVRTATAGMRDAVQLEFTIEDGDLRLLDAVPVPRTARSALRIAVDLADAGVLSRDEALMRIPPRSLTELLHRRIDPRAARDVLVRGIGASPGAATGRIVFSADAAVAAAARGEPCILVRHETQPEDVRGMHAASGVVTERGGVTSHAAVIARGIGVPCVVGAAGLTLDLRHKRLIAPDGRNLLPGDVITIDGGTGEVLAGGIDTEEPALDRAFETLMAWADAVRTMAVRANADTPAEAAVAKSFRADGIGLCRTEHMFFEDDRLVVMREVIFTDNAADRRAALERLLPFQRADFAELFRIMADQPVCIRLLDPPLHEFLPKDRGAVHELAAAMNLPVSSVMARIEDIEEFNPMLGLRGVRLGITMPEIYEMQARAIFEATVEVGRDDVAVVPEIMIPLVSARREVELVKSRIDAVAAAVRGETRTDFDFRLGVMVETPRAALRAGEIAQHVRFLSFGTNDLTQMTYGLSRDDSGRFMRDYVAQGVFPEDPFHTLDPEGVGELLEIAASRGREARPDLTISICGEHGGSPESIAFCQAAGFDYVSCSPFRVPVARLAAAQVALDARSVAASG